MAVSFCRLFGLPFQKSRRRSHGLRDCFRCTQPAGFKYPRCDILRNACGDFYRSGLRTRFSSAVWPRSAFPWSLLCWLAAGCFFLCHLNSSSQNGEPRFLRALGFISPPSRGVDVDGLWFRQQTSELSYFRNGPFTLVDTRESLIVNRFSPRCDGGSITAVCFMSTRTIHILTRFRKVAFTE